VAFIEPLLKKLRETSNAAPPFAPGPAEKQFRGIADAQVARQIAQSWRFGLVDSLARRLLNQTEPPVEKLPAPFASTDANLSLTSRLHALDPR